MKHTKGEWTCSMNPLAVQPPYFVNVNRKAICKVGNVQDPLASEEIEANAKLIAAAPELLNALVRISKIENGAFGLKPFDVLRFKSEINEAIKKATL